MTDMNEVVDLDQAELPDIPFNHASLEGRELEYVQEAIRSGHPSSGGEFAERTATLLAEHTGAEEVLLTTSCTAALELSAMLLDLKPGDTVIVPSFTFTTTALAFARQGAGLVFCDIERAHAGPRPGTPRHAPRRERACSRGRALRRDRLRRGGHPGGARGLAGRRPDRGQRARAVRQLAGPAPGQPRPVRGPELPRDQELRLRRGRRTPAERPPRRRPRPGALRQGHQPPGVHAGPGRQVHLEGHWLLLRSRRRSGGVPARPARAARGHPGQAPGRARALRTRVWRRWPTSWSSS